MNTSLGESASRGAAVTVLGQVIRIVVQLGGIMILARLLTPTDYGLLAMVTAIIGVGELIRDFGLSSAAIQARTLSRGQKNNLFWINASMGATLMLLTISASWLIAAFYGDDRLQPIAAALSVTFLLNGLSTQFRADMSRNLRFGRLVVVETSAQALGLAVGLAMAFAGTGYWALVGQQIGQTVAALGFLIALARWFPGGISRGEPMRGLLGYGVNMFGTQLLTYTSRNVDSIVIGARFGAADLGLYNRAFQLMMLPLLQLNAPSTRVALPVLSRLQDDKARYAAFITFGQTALLSVIGAVLALLGAQAESVIRIMLGPQWLEAVPVFRILLVAGFFQAAGYASYWVFLSKGLMRQNLYYSLVTRPLMIVAILVGSIWGMYGVAIAYSASIAIMWPLSLLWVRRSSDAPVGAMFFNGARAIIVFGLGCVVSGFSTIWIDPELPFIRVIVGGLVLLAWLGLVALVWPRFRRDMVELASARRFFKRRRKAAGTAAVVTEPELAEALEDPALSEGEERLERPHDLIPGDEPPAEWNDDEGKRRS
ncbi:lipopolysaccharide biosynthesis protein [Microbacterium sp. SS28]|uniref:lipopolysaccharide biosynthesis protein n=1 Tax=Microbacterium sp. SS28 TaxID=2919948 RepID=UPI001FAB3245|nr:lipopolysaccharide biosynthesis protein [Microbacterium sp. SS28]